MSRECLPIHGFVLAGGKSSRMGKDKALLPFCGVPLIEIAVARLQAFCADVSILGSRDDLRQYAPIVHDLRSEIGPGAGFEAALHASEHKWSLFTPIDVPLVPIELLSGWGEEVLEEAVCSASFLVVGPHSQPAFSMLHAERKASLSAALDCGSRRLHDLLLAADAGDLSPACAKHVARLAANATTSEIDLWFSNINSPGDLAEAENWAYAKGWQPPTLR